MHKENFLQLQSDFPHSHHIESARLSAVNIEATLRVLAESI